MGDWGRGLVLAAGVAAPPRQEHLAYCSPLLTTLHTPPPVPLQVWAVRENVCELALGLPALQLAAVPFYGLTALLVAAAFGLSILVPSIYVSFSC